MHIFVNVRNVSKKEVCHSSEHLTTLSALEVQVGTVGSPAHPGPVLREFPVE